LRNRSSLFSLTEGELELNETITGRELVEVKLDEVFEHYGRFRLHHPEAERAMARSLLRWGQLSPVVVCVRQGRYELVDGFKRLGAARSLDEWERVAARVMEADDKAAKAAMYGLNRIGGKTSELEEAWIVYALVREDGVSQVEVAELLGRHKTWVCRRLALVEKLSDEAKEELRVGLLSPTAARHVARLPQGNQSELLKSIHREALTVHELEAVANLLLQAPSAEQQRYVLEHPRQALSQAKGPQLPGRDPRLSPGASQLWRRLSALLEMLARMESFLSTQGRAGLTARDRELLAPRFERLHRDATSVATLSRDLVGELTPR
jgi:ParB/RepB/Spo0J family partition protein